MDIHKRHEVRDFDGHAIRCFLDFLLPSLLLVGEAGSGLERRMIFCEKESLR